MIANFKLWIARRRLARAARREAYFRFQAEKVRALLPTLEGQLDHAELGAYLAG